MRCKLLVVTDVLLAIYVTCSYMLCSDQTCMQEHVQEMCALDKVIWWYA
jgi:hypothetical protein